jgi:epoxyqueuosine reductase QueG
VSARDEPKDGYAACRYDAPVRTVQDLREYLADVVRTDPRNRLPEGENFPIFDEPVLGIASAEDPIFAQLQEPGVVGPIHRPPGYWLPGARSVISFFAPFSKEVKASYKKGQRLPSLEWVSSRLNGEVFINVMRRALLRRLQKQGAAAVVPNLDPRYTTRDWLPMWSERHVAFIAGIGTFGLHAGLLTEKGAAGRIGSVVTDVGLEPSSRPYASPYDYCLWFTEKRCGLCIKSCPVQAISQEGKDHRICITNGNNYIRPAYKEWGYHSCGHCQNNLPCSNGIPR